MKIEPSENLPDENSPTPTQANSLGEDIPPGAAYVAKLQSLSPRDFITQLFEPKLRTASDKDAKLAIESFAGLLSGIPQFYDFHVQVPSWVKTASRKHWENCGIDFNEIQNRNMAEIGKCIGLIDLSFGTPATEIENAASDFMAAVKVEAAKSPAKDAAQFFVGADKAEQICERMKELPKRIKVFMLISMAWRHVETFENAGQLHRWLQEIDAFDGSITDPAETRKICRLVGLKLSEKAGKPAKRK